MINNNNDNNKISTRLEAQLLLRYCGRSRPSHFGVAPSASAGNPLAKSR